MPGRHRQNALAHRTRLPGPQAGNRARPLRGTRMAGLPPPWHAMHRGLRIPDFRAGDDSPLRTSFLRGVHAICPTPWLQTPRRPRSRRNVTSPTRSQHSVADWLSRSHAYCQDAHAARADLNERHLMRYDAVRLAEATLLGTDQPQSLTANTNPNATRRLVDVPAGVLA